MKRAKKTPTKTETSWDVLKRTAGSARIVIEDERFGTRYLGGEDFCVFPSVEAARKEIQILSSNENARAIDSWEIHVLREDGLWRTERAGVFNETTAPGKRRAA